MDIPVNADGRFEVVDQQGTVVGEGSVNGSVVYYAEPGGEPVPIRRDQFESGWALFPQFRVLTIRAAP